MPDVIIQVGGRSFEVACQAGEEHYLKAAASMLDAEATSLTSQTGRIPEAKMLLMAGLMLADKTAALEERLREAQEATARRDEMLQEIQSKPAPEAERIEVPVIPEEVTETLAELAARAEALAGDIEAQNA